MTTHAPPTLRSAEFFRLLDAGDGPGILALCADDIQKVDESTDGWLRGKPAMVQHLTEGLPALSECRSVLEDATLWRAGDVEVETFMLRQGYVYDGTRYDIVAPTTMIWRQEDDAWTVTLIHTVPLPPAA